MTAWITQAQAAKILGVNPSAVPKMVSRGELTPRGGPRSEPSLERTKVEALAARRAQARDELRQRQDAVLQRRTERGRQPDEEHDWLSVPAAARLAGITRQAMHLRADRGRVPVVEVDGRRWIRRDHLQLAERARAAQRSGLL